MPKRLQAWSLFNIWLRTYLFSSKIRYYFRGSCCSQCFILSAAFHCSLPSQFFFKLFLSNYQEYSVPLTSFFQSVSHLLLFNLVPDSFSRVFLNNLPLSPLYINNLRCFICCNPSTADLLLRNIGMECKTFDSTRILVHLFSNKIIKLTSENMKSMLIMPHRSSTEDVLSIYWS